MANYCVTHRSHGATELHPPYVYFRYLPPISQMDLVRENGKRAFIAGATVSGKVPKNWKHVVDVGIDAVLTDYPLELAKMLRESRHQ